MLMIILVVGTMLIKTLIDFHEEEKIRNNEAKGIINKSEDTGKDITDQSTETIIHGPMYIKIYNHLENLYYDGNENVEKFENEFSYYFIDKETKKVVMFTVNRRDRLFGFMVEAKSDGVNSRIIDKIANDNYIPYGKDINQLLGASVYLCLDEASKGNYLTNEVIKLNNYKIHLTFVLRENYYYVFFIDDIEQ
jgi:hypothetical protein